MKIRDIVNREIINLTNCEHEPIHIPGSIQPHGFLFGIDRENFRVEYCSGNTLEYIGRRHDSLLGKTYGEIFGEAALQELKSYIGNGVSSSPLPMETDGRNFLCSVHDNGEMLVFEGEPVVQQAQTIGTIYDQTSQFLGYMNETNSLRELSQLVAQGTRELTGYDRVMVYRFDKDYNGEVFAESRNDELEPFLGLHYPHTDIPVQARKLYLKNLLRLISDVDYVPVPIYTLDDGGEKKLDLGQAVLRSISPIHIQYLQNMGVGATLTISLIHNKKLWGLIACHHYSPKNLTPEIRLAAQLQGHFLTSQIDVRMSNEEYEVSRHSNAALEKLNSMQLEPGADSFENVIKRPELLGICNASGVSIQFNGRLFTQGLVPCDDDIVKLSDWLFEHTNGGYFSTDKLIDFHPTQESLCKVAAGLVYHCLGTTAKNAVIWYRPETITQVNWAGDPNKAIEKDENGLSPRKSFELWKEFLKCQSLPWQNPELNAAANYAHSLQRHMNLSLLAEESQRNIELSQILKETNSELENINWISTHDLQEPLRKIQLIASRLLTVEGETISPKVVDALMRMNNSANRMQTLLIDILKYTRIQHHQAVFETVALTGLVEHIADEIREHDKDHDSVIRIGELPKIDGVPFLLKQLFSNLLSNAIKYRKPEIPPKIAVQYSGVETRSGSEKPGKFIKITISDNGIGFEQKFADSIFHIFTRLHAQVDYKGSGVGLALCRKIMQAHQGFIEASSTLGVGSEFYLYFPVQEQRLEN